MKRYLKILKVFGLLVLLLALAGFLLTQALKPDYDGTRPLAGVQDSVRVLYDPYGIPHIYGSTEADAFRALGYVHAQDRLWQMELLRRVAIGGLSEVFGPDQLNTDRFFLSLGIDESSRAAIGELDPASQEYLLVTAYLDGVNAFIAEGPTPPEFYLTGLDKTPFQLEDVYNSLGYMAFSFAMAHKTDPFLTEMGRRLGPAYLEELLREEPGSTTFIRSHVSRDTAGVAYAASSKIRRLLEGLPLPALEGSNAWVVGPSKTQSGKVLFANDPHIGFAQPSVWFEAHLATPSYERYGYHLAGIPFPLLAHNRRNAYGMTMFENDDIDFYRETTDLQDSNRYLRPEGWKTFQRIEKTIRVKGSDPVPFSYRRSDLGPLMNDLIRELEGGSPVSMSWVYTQGPNQVLQSLNRIAHAADLSGFEQAVRQIHAPGLNVMYGDADGNVAWWAAARLYRLPDSVSTKLVQEGAQAGPDFFRPVPFSENPKAINPPWGYVYSANNQPDSTGAGYIPGYYLPENRALRITELLEARDDWDREAMMEMITDDTSPVNPKIVSNMAKYLDVKQLNASQIECVDALNKWQGDYPLTSSEALLFHRWIYYFLRDTFADEMGEEGFKTFLGTHLIKRMIAVMAMREESVWWDDTRTADTVEDKAAIIGRSFQEAMESVYRDFGKDPGDWSWSRVHELEHKHPIGTMALFRPLFNVGPFPVPGSQEVINNMAFNFDTNGHYPVTSGPSTRRIIDFSDIENSMSILPTGQSGNPFSPHYDDQAEMYARGEFRKMMLNRSEIREAVRHTLIFVPR